MIQHKHYIVNADVDWFFKRNSKHWLHDWLQELVHDLGMNMMAGPLSFYNERAGLEGWSATCLIETSHIALHVWDAENPIKLRLDVYTCGEMNLDVIRSKINEFQIKEIHGEMLLDREHKIEVIDF